MKNFKTVPNHTSKLRFPWETINYPDLLTNFLENGELVGDSQFRLTPKTDKVSQITTSVVVDSYHVSKHGQVSTLDSGFVDIQKQKSTDNIIPSFVTNLLDNNIGNSPFFTANIGLKKNHNDSELEQCQPIHAVVSSNLGNHVESVADTVISRTIVEVSKNPETQLDETKVKDNLKVIFADTLQNNSELDLLDIYGIVDQALRDSYDYLSKFRFDPEYSQKLETAFGTDFNREVADKLFNNFAEGNFTDIPTIKIVNRADIYGGNGAFSADTGLIYLTVEFLKEHYRNTARITDVLLEETGHFVDSQINKIDSAGDEGEIFSNLVQGNTLTEKELQALKSENDIATVISSNQGITMIPNAPEITIENNTTLRVGTWNVFSKDSNSVNTNSFPGSIAETLRRINYIAQYSFNYGIDIVVLQEIPNSTNRRLASDLRALKTNPNAPILSSYDKTGLTKLIGNYNYEVVESEYPTPNILNNNKQTTDGYLILYNSNTIKNITTPTFYYPGNFVDQATGTQYRPPVYFKFQDIPGNVYNLLTWHNEVNDYNGIPHQNTAANNTVNILDNVLKNIDPNYQTNQYILLGDLNVRPRTMNGVLPNMAGNRSPLNRNDFILTNKGQIEELEIISPTGGLDGNLFSDAHYAMFAKVTTNTAIPATLVFGNVQFAQVSQLIGAQPTPKMNPFIANGVQYEYAGNSPEPSWENQLIKIGKKERIFTPLTNIDGGKVTVRKETVDGQIKESIYVEANSKGKTAKVYSGIGFERGSALFNGNLKFDTTTLTGTITDEGDSSDPSAFKLIGGLEVNFEGLSFGEDANGSPQLRLQGSMVLPKNLVGGNGLLVAINGTDYIGISDNGVSVTGGFVKLPGTTSFVVLGLLEIKALDAQVKFDFTNEEITLQGEFTIPSLKNATFDLQGGNYIKVKKTATGLDFSMVANVTTSNIPIIPGSWEIQDIKLNVNKTSTNNSFVVNAKLKTPGSPINLALAFNQGTLTQITGSSGIGTDFTFLGAAVDIRTVSAIIDRNTTDPEFTLQGEIEIPTLKGLKGSLTGTNKLVVNKDKAYLTGATLSAADIQLGNWKLRNIQAQASFNGTTNTFSGSAILQTYSGENIGVSLLFDSNGLQNITASNIRFNLFGATVSGATISFTPDRNGGTYDWDPEFKLQGTLALPAALGGIAVSVTGTDYLLVNNNGFDLTGGRIYKESLDFNLLGLLRVQGNKISLLYTKVGAEKVFILQGTLILPDLYNLTGDFSGSNYIKISSIGTVEVVGSISASNISIAAGWTIKTATVSIDTTGNQTKVAANATVSIPSGINVAATVLWNGSQLQYIQIGASNLNEPIGSTGAFLQSIEGKYQGGNTSAFTGTVGITAGAEINLNLPSWAGGNKRGSLVDLKASATITSINLTANGEITVLGGLMKGTANAEVNWDKGYLWASSEFNILDGLITTNTQFLATSNLNLYMFGEANVNIPSFVPFIGGTNLGSGEVYVEYTNDNNLSNDYVAAWGTAFKGTLWESTIGIKVSFDGNWQVIHSQEARTIGQYATTKIKTLHDSLDAPADKEPQHQIGDTIRDTPIIIGKNTDGTDGNDILHGENTPDTIYGKKGNDLLFGEDGNDTLSGDDGEDMLYGGTGNDYLYGGAGNDYLYGDDGDDVLDGGTGNDHLYGGKNDDTYIVDSTTDTIIENANEGTDTIQSSVTYTIAALANVENLTLTGTTAINGTGNAANNVITGNTGNNILDGGAGNDYLNGLGGNDTLIGGLGNDTLNGGWGEDTADYSSATQGINVTLGAFGFATNDGFGYQDSLTGIDHIIGSQYNDIIVGDDYWNNTLNGGAGNDYLNGLGGSDTLISGDGKDILYGDPGGYIGATIYQHDSYGGQAQDLRVGNYDLGNLQIGNDSLSSLQVSPGFKVTLYEHSLYTGSSRTFTQSTNWVGNFNDKTSSIKVEYIGATIYQHVSYGGKAQDLRVGNYDLQNLQIGNDSLSSLQVSPGFKVTLYEHSRYTGSSRTFTESTNWVGDFNDKTSSIKVEYINSNDTLNGGADDDNLYGGYGNDILTGGLGKDALTGGLGTDRFDYRNLADSVLNSFDVITDFNATAGNDLFLVATARTGFSNAGSVATLDTNGIAVKLTTATFTANAAAQFSFGSRTFVAINDATAGFSATTDAIIEVTGLTGTLGLYHFTTTLA
ncbi:MAG: bluetail domain-containing putative surface protein [Dolichospermum lemmermannii FEM_B0920]